MAVDTRALKQAVAMCVLTPTLVLGGSAAAASLRWNEPEVLATQNDGVQLVGLALQGQSMVHTLSTPYFLLNGARFELLESHRTSAPRVAEGPGVRQISTAYEVPTPQGTVQATLSQVMLDPVSEDSNAAQLSSWIRFDGPVGDYQFFWRMDLDVGSRRGNRVERSIGGAQVPLTREAMLDLSQETVQIVDPSSFQEQARVQFNPRAEDGARLYVTQFNGAEVEAHPATLLNSEALTGRPDGGADLVLWYETRLSGVSSGLTGPDMTMIAATRVNATLEQDKMTGAQFSPSSITVFGEQRSFAGAYGAASINVKEFINDDASIANDTSSTNSELHSLMTANKDYEYKDSSTNWYSWVITALQSSSGPGVLGIMFDDGATNNDGKPRQGCAVFYDPHTDGSWPEGDSPEAELLLTLTHETGHVYNQHHEDFCAGRFSGSTFRSNSAIMGYAFMDTSRWTFSPGTVTTLSSEPEEYSRPGHGYAFTSNGSYNTTDAHEGKHSSTSCRRVCCLNQ